MTTRTFIGKGTIYIKLRSAAAGLLPIGNASKLELDISEDKKDLMDYQNAGGGKANSISRIKDVTAAITMHNLSGDNLALVTRGSASAVAAGAVVAEQHTAYANALVPFDNLPDITQTITVKDSTATTTYTEGTDYTVTRVGIIIATAGAIVDASIIKIDYTKAIADVVETLVNSAQEYTLTLDGLNEADSGKAALITIYRAKFSPTQKLGLIGDDFAGMDVSADVLKDDTITGAGLSQYAKIMMAA